MEKKKESGLDPEMEELRRDIPEDVKRILDADGIETMEDLFLSIIKRGYDPVKLVNKAGNNQTMSTRRLWRRMGICKPS